MLELHQLIISFEAPAINKTEFMNCDMLSLAFHSPPPKAFGDVELCGASFSFIQIFDNDIKNCRLIVTIGIGK